MVEFLSGVGVGLLAGWSIQKQYTLSKLRLLHKMGLLKMADEKEVAPACEKYLKEQLEKLGGKK